ncbi:hypothetical protein Unana1_06669 [Umbelopsis nana]
MSSKKSEVKTTYAIGREPTSAALHARPRNAEATEVIESIEDRPKEEKWQDTEHITKIQNDPKGVIGRPQFEITENEQRNK